MLFPVLFLILYYILRLMACYCGAWGNLGRETETLRIVPLCLDVLRYETIVISNWFPRNEDWEYIIIRRKSIQSASIGSSSRHILLLKIFFNLPQKLISICLCWSFIKISWLFIFLYYIILNYSNRYLAQIVIFHRFVFKWFFDCN